MHEKKSSSKSFSMISRGILGVMMFLLLWTTTSCRTGSGAFYEWCEKRGFPRICKKYF